MLVISMMEAQMFELSGGPSGASTAVTCYVPLSASYVFSLMTIYARPKRGHMSHPFGLADK